MTLLKNVFDKLIETRQSQAYSYVARKLQSEYPYESYEYILKMLKEGKANELSR